MYSFTSEVLPIIEYITNDDTMKVRVGAPYNMFMFYICVILYGLSSLFFSHKSTRWFPTVLIAFSMCILVNIMREKSVTCDTLDKN